MIILYLYLRERKNHLNYLLTLFKLSIEVIKYIFYYTTLAVGR